MRRAIGALPAASVAVAWFATASAGPFPAVLELSVLDGTNGFILNGTAERNATGYSANGAGDVNGDGTEDIILSAHAANPDGREDAGQSYVVFGGTEVGGTGVIELAGLDGKNGVVFNGISPEDALGLSVDGVGDVNGDGLADVILGALHADPPERAEAGQSYVVFGGMDVDPSGRFELANLDGSNGFTLNGWYLRGESGCCVASGGDINGDGYGDFIIGAVWADPGDRQDAGQTYVVFGRPDVGDEGVVELALLDGWDGFIINGIDVRDNSARAVGGAGDVNGDGFDDIIIGAFSGDSGAYSSGEAYVVFGGPRPFPSRLELSSLDGGNGFMLRCIDFYDRCGISVDGAGDVNGDGLDDVIVGAFYADTNDDVNQNAGETYLVFGASDIGAAGLLDLSHLDGANGFVLRGAYAGGWSGRQVSTAGDINADGVNDIIVGAPHASPRGRMEAGVAHVVYGRPGLGGTGVVELSALDGENGFVVHGINKEDEAGLGATCAGDVNADGIDDLIIGANDADPNGIEDAGEAYVIFGRATDTDGDGLADDLDNCTLLPNSDQRDIDDDGYGNRCDPDLTNNDLVNFADLGLLKAVFLTPDENADFDGNGIVNFIDLGIMKEFFFKAPGPSGIVADSAQK